MKVVILCGGKGTRLREKTESIPKALVEIGGRPILWHIMKIYSTYGFNEFVLCLGYKGAMIKDHFENVQAQEKWKIHFADTGEETNTGGRIKQIQPLISEKSFMVTYGDGVSDINLKTLVEFHQRHGKLGTVTAVNPPSQFGLLDIQDDHSVRTFREKPQIDRWINGGFFVLQKEFFNYLQDNEVLEQAPLEKLSRDRQLMAYRHHAFWKCMDTYKDTLTLNDLWAAGQAPWKIWGKS